MRKCKMLLVVMCIAMVSNVLIATVRPFYLRDIVNVFAGADPDVVLAKKLFWQLVMVAACAYVSYRVFEIAITFFEARIMKDLDERSFAAIQRQSICFFENSFSGSLMKSAIRFRNSFEGITDIIMQEVGRSVLIVSAAFVILLNTMPSFAALFGIWAFVFLLFTWVFLKYKYPLDTANANADTRVAGVFIDSLSNHLTVKSFGCEKIEQKRFNAVVFDSYRKRMKSWLVGTAGGAFQAIMMMLAELGLVRYMVAGWEAGVLTIGDFIFLQTYVIWIVTEMRSIGNSLRKLFQMIADAVEMADICDLEPEVKDVLSAHPLVISEGQIDIHALSFQYGATGSGKEFALDGVGIKIPAGQSVGLVGKTGAGKSTLMKLLMRLYDLDSGYIRIDMQDIANVTQESLRQQMAIVPQQPQLFHRSIRENIAFARPDATDDEIIEAAKQAYAWEFIEKLPQGLDTMVGERGVKLSGGQCQRIAIARAILADPRILLLDEATSALDSETEKYIQKAIENLLRGRTSIVIAHRLSTIMRMDRIVVMEHGKIIEDGKHEDLLEQKGMYANLWEHQSGGYISSEE